MLVPLMIAVNFKNMTAKIKWIKENSINHKISNCDIPFFEMCPTAHIVIARDDKLVMCPNKHDDIARDDNL